MLVSHSYRILFVHVQKTGGSSIDQFLTSHIPDIERVKGLPGSRHAKLRSALRENPELRDYFTFGFVRNPWARLLSWHDMIMRREQHAREGNEFVQERLAANNFWLRVTQDFPDFEDFVLQGTRELTRLGSPQLDWLRALGRTADFVGRTERLDQDLHEVLRLVGLSVPAGDLLTRANTGTPRRYREHYTPIMRERVAQVFADDISTFGYTF